MHDLDATDLVRRTGPPELVETDLVIIIRGPDGSLQRFPVCQTQLTLGRARESRAENGPDIVLDEPRMAVQQARMIYLEGHRSLLITNLDDGLPAYFNGRLARHAELRLKDELRLGSYVLELESLEPLAGSLEGYNDPVFGRLFYMGARDSRIGRPGKRDNDILLEDKSISREHATMRWSGSGFDLVCETSNLTEVNTRPLTPDQSVDLQDGDLVQLGKLLFRFRLLSDSQTTASADLPRLRVVSLGAFRVWRGSEMIEETSWRSQNVRTLLARLAAEWGRPVPVEKLMDEFWPDLDPERGKKNLNWTLSRIRAQLKTASHPGLDYLTRTQNTVQLDPEALEHHDYSEVRRLLKMGKDPYGRALEQVWALYQGPYLEDCYMDWAVSRRSELESLLLSRSRAYMLECAGRQAHAEVLAFGPRVLSLDPCSQEAYRCMMESHAAQGSPQEALKLFDQCSKVLKKELDLEPSVDLMRERQRALLLL